MKDGSRNAKVPARPRSLGGTVSVFVRDFVDAGAGLAFLLGGVQESLRTGVSVRKHPAGMPSLAKLPTYPMGGVALLGFIG